MAAIKSQENSRLQVKSGVDLVTETDKAAEMAIIDLLKASHPVSFMVFSQHQTEQIVPMSLSICECE